MTLHLLPPPDVPAPLTERATRAASVNASFTPRLRFAEHSVYIISISLLSALIVSNISSQIWHQRTQIPECLYPLCNLQPLLIINHDLLSASPLCSLLVLIRASLSQVAFQRHEHELHSLTILCYLAYPFRFNILKGVLRVDAETKHNSVGVIVGEGTQSVEFLLACCVPEGELDVYVIDENVCMDYE